MAKRHRVVLPSLSKSTKGKVVGFSLFTKLEPRNVQLLEEHGYEVTDNVKVTEYRLLAPRLFQPFLLFVYMLLQDFLKGQPFNSNRYPYYLMFLVSIYNQDLSEKQTKKLDEYLGESQREMQINGKTFTFKKTSSVKEEKQDVVNTPPAVVEPTPKKIILIASSYAGVGKSVFSNSLVESIGEDTALKLAFMDELRGQLAYLFSISNLSPDAFFPENYNKTKNVAYRYSEDIDPFVLRELICDYSDLLQKYFGKTYWAAQATDFMKNTDSNVFVIDDLRRPIELDYLRKQFGAENIITVYLTKEDAIKPELAGSSLAYEGLLDPNEFDIQFEFNSDWSNTTDLIKTITERL